MLQAVDVADSVYLEIVAGRVVHVGKTPVGASLTVRSALSVLMDILQFRRDPNEPYLFGELTVQGAEDDFMRLDYVMTRLCG